MNVIMEYLAHWVIGIAAFVIWGWGKTLGVEVSLVSYAAFILPSVVAAAGVQAIGKRQNPPVTIQMPVNEPGNVPINAEPPVPPAS